jgi:putative hydrolase of the HAD superfamily
LSAVLLDALGTLVALQPPAPRLRDELLARFGVTVTVDVAETAIAAEIGYYRAHLNEGRDADSLAALRLRCAAVLREALGPAVQGRVPDGSGLLDALLASLRFEPFADALEALPRWRAAGRRVVVVSNWDVSLHVVLDRVGLGGQLDAIVTSAEAGARKPDVAIFDRALRLAGVPASEAVHVGDSVAEDVAGARRAGIEAVLLLRDGSSGPDGVRTISSLLELG